MKILGMIIVLVLFFINSAHADDAADLGTIVVESSRSNDTVGQMNKDVDIITSEDIAASPAKNLPELLSQVPGVDARVNSSIKDQQIDMGGFGESSLSNVVILVDGRRLNTPDLAAPDLSTINLNSIDHIEVIHGAATVLYGDNATGGVINIITKKGRENARPSVTLTSEIDSYKGNKDGMDLNGGLSHLTYQFDYDRQQTDNYRTNNNYWADDYNSRLNYNPTDIFGIDFSQGYHLDRYSLPGGISMDEIRSGGLTGVNSTRTGAGATSVSHFDITPHMKFDVGGSSADLSLFSSAGKSDNNVTFSSGYSTNYEDESYEFQPKLILSTPLTDRLDNKLTSGYDYIYYREKRRIDTSSSLEDIVYASEASQGVYLLDELDLDRHWLFNAGVRGAWAGYTFNQTQQTAQKFDRSPTTEGYEGGLGYKYNPDSKIFVDYTRSYRLPNLDEFFQNPYPGGSGSDTQATINPSLTYQVGNQYQLGVKDHSFKDVNWGATFTEVQYKNEIYDDPNAYPGNINYSGRTRHYSEEADIAVDLFNRIIEPFANITFQQTEFIKGQYSGSQIPDVPNYLAHAGITFRPLERLSTTISTNFVGKRFGIGDDANLYPKIKEYDTFDWSARYDFRNIEVWVSLNNLFDTRYFVYGSSYGLVYGSAPEIYYPAPGRNVEAGLKVKF